MVGTHKLQERCNIEIVHSLIGQLKWKFLQGSEVGIRGVDRKRVAAFEGGANGCGCDVDRFVPLLIKLRVMPRSNTENGTIVQVVHGIWFAAAPFGKRLMI